MEEQKAVCCNCQQLKPYLSSSETMMLHHMLRPLTLILCLLHLNTFAQLPNGSIAPDFTLTDYYGTEHELYSYLDEGKTVFVEIFAAHCPSCWNYHQTHTLKDLYNNYGPNGTDEVMVLALEYDQWNGHNAFIGDGDPWVTQGNWLEGTPYPIFNVESPHRGVFDDYDVSFYPVVYKVCPDRVLEQVSISATAGQLYDKVQACQHALAVSDLEDLGAIYVNDLTGELMIEEFEKVNSLRILNTMGQTVHYIGTVNRPRIALQSLSTGVYLFQLQTEKGQVTRKLLVY